MQLGELVLQNIGVDDWQLEKCGDSCGCFIHMVGIYRVFLQSVSHVSFQPTE